MEIFKIKTFKRSTDGRLISFTLETDGSPLEIDVNTDALASIVQTLAGVVWEAQRANPSNILSIETPSQAQVQSTKNHDGVVMRFLMSNHLEYLFALANPDAIQFRARLDKVLAGHK